MSLAGLSSWAAWMPLANHLWQSTIFVGVIWLVTTLALKKNSAAVRYWLWFAASVKFLVPFSLLVALGSKFDWRTTPAIAQPQWSFVMDNLAQPFSAAAPAVRIAAPHASFPPPAVLLCVWLCGVVLGVAFWLHCWSEIRAVRRSAKLLALGLPIPVLSSRSQFEPGVFGIFHPVLLLPQGIADRLTPAQLDAIMFHEMCHVRRRDNLTAAIHMIVETIFWFHPLVWWIRARLVQERERACDEEVLRRGSDPDVYAEGILSVCKFYAESPMVSAAGVSGSDLRERIKRITSEHPGQTLNLARKMILIVLCVTVIAVPLLFGIMNAPPLCAQAAQSAQTRGALPTSFEVASIKPDTSGTPNHQFQEPSPGRIHTVNASTRKLIEFAYSLNDSQLIGGPGWTSSRGYVVDAKADDATAAQLQKLPGDQQRQQMQLMMRSLLADRFKLAMSHQTKELPIYALMVAKGGQKLTPRAYKAPDSSWRSFLLPQHPPHVLIHPGEIDAYDQPISTLAGVLALIPDMSDRLVEDETGIKGNYDFTLHFSPRSAVPNSGTPSASATADDGSEPSIFTALGEQLGLKIEPTKGPVDIYTIDHIEEPSPN
jgi:bla regulator protein blaR1